MYNSIKDNCNFDLGLRQYQKVQEKIHSRRIIIRSRSDIKNYVSSNNDSCICSMCNICSMKRNVEV